MRMQTSFNDLCVCQHWLQERSYVCASVRSVCWLAFFCLSNRESCDIRRTTSSQNLSRSACNLNPLQWALIGEIYEIHEGSLKASWRFFSVVCSHVWTSSWAMIFHRISSNSGPIFIVKKRNYRQRSALITFTSHLRWNHHFCRFIAINAADFPSIPLINVLYIQWILEKIPEYYDFDCLLFTYCHGDTLVGITAHCHRTLSEHVVTAHCQDTLSQYVVINTLWQIHCLITM